MFKEEFVEEGIVTEVKDGIATIYVTEKGGCEECSAKIFCKKDESEDKRRLVARDNFGVRPGDSVRVSLRAGFLLNASFLIYGLPVVLMLALIIGGMSYFSSDAELKSSLLAIGVLAFYYTILSTFKKVKKVQLPEIVFVKR
jgi:positive regulator of sigma E activity